MNQILSAIYPGLPVDRLLTLNGVIIKDLKTFTEIVKTDSDLCIKKYLALFSNHPDGYPEDILIEAYNSVKPLDPKEIFSERFNNVELRAAIIAYVNPETIFKTVKTRSLAKATLKKRYPRVKTKGQYGKPSDFLISPQDIEVEYVERFEKYELIQIIDLTLCSFLPWNERVRCQANVYNMPLFIIKMECPSSKKTYYEYIAPDAIDLNLTPENTIKKALSWQMRKANHKPISVEEYNNILSET